MEQNRDEDVRPFRGSEALVNGQLNKHQLRSRFRAVFPDVYLPRDIAPTLWQRTQAGWLWSHREGVIAGLAAAAMHGAKWIDDDVAIELIWQNARTPRGVQTRDSRLLGDEYLDIDGLLVTSPTRTAFDIGCRWPLRTAVARIDALASATNITASQVCALADRHRGTRGIRTLRRALELVDRGAQSPKETWLRLLLIDDGLPRPLTQIPIVGPTGLPLYYIDMGWPELKVGVEYDGDQHRTDRQQYVRDIRRLEALEALGWIIVRVITEDRPETVLRRVRDAIQLRRDCGEVGISI